VAGTGRELGPKVGDRDWILPDWGDPRHVVAVLVEGVANDYRIVSADAAELAKDPEHARWTQLVGVDARVRDETISGHWLFVRSTRDARRFRVLRYDLDKPAAAPVVVVAQQRGVIESIQGTADGLYYVMRTGSSSELYHLPAAGGKPQRVSLPFTGAV